ncbi:MAG: pitrilysin family protein [Candidatus Krumholzibacteriia bacterium]
MTVPPLQRRPEDPRVATAVLDNGVRLIVAEHRRTPVAICHVWVRVGSNWEPEHLRGWSHGIEHMIFKGSDRRGESDFAREVAAAGGSSNAGTGYETTSYHVIVPVEELPKACDLLADGLFGARFDAASLDSERHVLVHENHMYDDIPFGFGITWKWALEMALDHSPYRHPIGGRDEALLEAPREEIVGFYRRMYRPDNTTVVVVGDIGAEQARDLVARTFGRLPRPSGPLQLTEPPVEPPRHELRYRLASGDLKHAYAKLVFLTPGERSAWRPALSVLHRLLTDGRSCRLFRVVQEERQLVSEIAAASESGPREGLIVVDLECEPERLAEALTATAEVLESLKQGDLPENELVRARVRTRRAVHFGSETVQGLAARLGRHDAMGDLADAFRFPDRVDAVTAADVKALARRVFGRERLACLVYLPRDLDPRALGIPRDAAGLEALLAPVLSHADSGAEAPPAQPDTGEAAEHTTKEDGSDGGTGRDRRSPATAVERAAAPPRPGQMPRFTSADLAGGLRVHYLVDRAEPIWSAAVVTPGGVLHETAADSGLAALGQQVQVKGAAGVPASVLHDRIETLGATLSAQLDRDFTGLLASGLRRNRREAFALLGDTIVRPDFRDDELERERRLAREQLAAVMDTPLQAAALELRAMIYGDHPYGRPLVGTEPSLLRLGRDDLVSWHRRTWLSGPLELVLVGDVDPEHDLPRLEAALAEPRRAEPPARPQLAPARRPAGPEERRLTRDQKQCVLLLGWPGAPDPVTDRVSLLVLRELLNGQSGRLFDELRNRRSLCYNAGIMGVSGFAQGLLAAYVLTAPESEAAARAALLEVLSGVAEQPVPESELERVRAKLAGNLLIANQSGPSRAARCARDLIYGRGSDDLEHLVDGVRACPATAVQDAAHRYLTTDRFFEVVAAPGD